MKHNYSGKSLLELRAEYGIGGEGFYNNSWWKNKAFASEKPPKGVYEIELGEDLTNLSFKEQEAKLKKGFTPIHPAILADFILSTYKKTKERFLEKIWCRTSVLGSGGYRVYVGDFDESGLGVYRGLDDDRYGDIGLSCARKFGKGNLKSAELEPIEPLDILPLPPSDLEKRVSTIEKILTKYNFTL